MMVGRVSIYLGTHAVKWGKDPITLAPGIHYIVIMKNIMSRHNHGMLIMAVLLSAFMAGGASQLRADDWGGPSAVLRPGWFL